MEKESVIETLKNREGEGEVILTGKVPGIAAS